MFFFIYQECRHLDLALPLLLIATTVNLSTLFIYCYFGLMSSDSYGEMADCLYGSNWQRLPTDLQKYIVLVMANMRRSLYYHGFEVFVLDLRTSLKVNHYFFFKRIFCRIVFLYHCHFLTQSKKTH